MYKGDEKIRNKIIIPVGVSVIVLSVTSVILSLFLNGIIRFPTTDEESSKVLPDTIKLTELGSASELEGNVTLVSVFANDSRYSWTLMTKTTFRQGRIYSVTQKRRQTGSASRLGGIIKRLISHMLATATAICTMKLHSMKNALI